jgi:hypothetical protein
MILIIVELRANRCATQSGGVGFLAVVILLVVEQVTFLLSFQ